MWQQRNGSPLNTRTYSVCALADDDMVIVYRGGGGEKVYDEKVRIRHRPTLSAIRSLLFLCLWDNLFICVHGQQIGPNISL